MIGRIPENILDDILNRCDIVEVISSYIPLKRAGRNFRANCPFHHEKTPSFMVSPDRQIYHCFGCNAGGNAFNFLMQYERLEFLEAVEMLAQKAGVSLPKAHKQDEAAVSLSTQLYKVTEAAALFYENILHSEPGAAARSYLQKRGVNQAGAKLFKLGYAVDKWDSLINNLRVKGFSLSLLEKAGLILSRENSSGYYDRFRNRIIFPIFDIKSRVIAFGGRVLDEALPKYMNSPETPVYTKGKNLYGLNFAKDAIRDNDCVVIVEGYLDFLMPYQAGFQNIIASLGTALTLEQARLLKRYTHNVVMVYDPDAAGIMATLRTLDIFIEEGMQVKVASLPSGLDPDLFVRKHGVDGFSQKVKSAQDLFDYKLGVLKSNYNPKDIGQKAKISMQMLQTINKFKNAVLRSEYIKKLAEDLRVEEVALLQELNNMKQDASHLAQPQALSPKALNINPTEKLLIKLMFGEGHAVNRIRGALDPDDFQDQRVSRVVSAIFDLAAQGKDIEPKTLVNYLEDASILPLICESALSLDSAAEDKDKVITDCLKRLKDQKVKNRQQRLHDQIKTAQQTGDVNRVHELTHEFHQLLKER